MLTLFDVFLKQTCLVIQANRGIRLSQDMVSLAVQGVRLMLIYREPLLWLLESKTLESGFGSCSRVQAYVQNTHLGPI